jgi:ABC-type antimicrobial peptide transport system permease subunit
VKGAVLLAWATLRRHRGQTLLTAAGIAAVSAMVAAAVTAGFGLRTGFDRAAERTDLPDVVATFDDRDLAAVRSRVASLPNIAAVSFRLRERRVHLLDGRGHEITSGQLEGVMPGRRGYAVVAGRDLGGGPHAVLVEHGLAREWHIGPGARIVIEAPHGRLSVQVVGVAVAADNVAYPLASEARVWMPYAAVSGAFAPRGDQVNEALVWVRDRSQLAVTLEQARAASFGIGGLVFVTRSGIRVFVDQAAGIVIALLVGFSVVALGAAAVMLAAAARVDVQRRLETLATMRAVGASRGRLVGAVALEKAMLAVPAAAVGGMLGWAAARGPTDRLLETLDQFSPGAALLPPMVAALAAVVGVVIAVTVWPAWRASARAIAPMLRSAELGADPRGRALPAGSTGLGMRMVVSRPLRTLATSVVLAASGAIVLLMLALAGLLDALQHDPGVVGKRYQLTTRGSASAVARAETIPGVAAAARRFRFDAADAFDLGQAFQVITYCGDRLTFESPALRSGRRAVHPGEAEVGRGLATALGLRPGATLAAAFPDGDEIRFRVVGVVDALDNDGRIAYVQPGPQICRFHGGVTVIRLTPGTDPAGVAAALGRTGRPAQTVGGVTSNDASFLGVLAALLRTIAVLDGLVCAYVVTQMMLLTARERRSSVAVLRACGAGRAHVAGVFAGAVLPAAALAAPVAVVLQRTVLGPSVADLAASYVSISLAAGGADVAVMVAGLAAITAGAAAWVSRQAMREPILAAIRDA